jgi:hypothetical protein
MGCCNKTPCNDGPVAFTPVTAPTEELMAVDTLLFGLLKVAKTGINTLNISNPVAAQLATTIAGLAAENEYLKKLMSALSPLTVTEAVDTVDIRFGPGGVYSLRLPVASEEQRRTLSRQFVAIAASLAVGKPATDPMKQMTMFED